MWEMQPKYQSFRQLRISLQRTSCLLNVSLVFTNTLSFEPLLILGSFSYRMNETIENQPNKAEETHLMTCKHTKMINYD